jgi:HAMP domain-containing protein
VSGLPTTQLANVVPVLRIRWYQSINFKLFAFIAGFVLATLAVGAVSYRVTLRTTMETSLQEQQRGEVTNVTSLVYLQLEMLKERVNDRIFPRAPANSEELEAGLKAFISAFPQVMIATVDWSGQTLRASSGALQQKDVQLLLDLGKDVAIGAQFLKFAGRPVLLQKFAVSQASAAVTLYLEPKHLRESLKNTRQQKAFLFSINPSGVSAPGQFPAVVISTSLGGESLFESEWQSDGSKLAMSSGTVVRTPQNAAPDVEYFMHSIPGTKIGVALRADYRDQLTAQGWGDRQTAYSGLVILSLAVLLTYFATVRFNQKLQELISATRRIAQGDLSHPVTKLPRSEIGVLGGAINAMAVQLANFLRGEVEAARKQQELLTAKAVEERFFLSERLPVPSRLRVKGTHRSASECAGDWWCQFHVNDSTDLVVVSDATGHGAGAALVVAIAYSFFQTHIHNVRSGAEKLCSPVELAKRLNRILCETSDGRSTMTMQIWLFDAVQQEARYVNCGHNAAFITRTPSKDSSVAEFEVRGVLNASDLLGMHPNADFSEQIISYSVLRRVFLYTDGLIECKARDGSLLRVKQVKKMLEEASLSDFKTGVLQFVSAVADRFKGLEVEDDITLVFIDVTEHVKGSPALAKEAVERSEPVAQRREVS